MFALHNNTNTMIFIKCSYNAWDEAEKKSKNKKRHTASWKVSKKIKNTYR